MTSLDPKLVGEALAILLTRDEPSRLTYCSEHFSDFEQL